MRASALKLLTDINEENGWFHLLDWKIEVPGSISERRRAQPVRVDKFSWPGHKLVSIFWVSCFCFARRAPSRVDPSSDPRPGLKRANAEAWRSVTALYAFCCYRQKPGGRWSNLARCPEGCRRKPTEKKKYIQMMRNLILAQKNI